MLFTLLGDPTLIHVPPIIQEMIGQSGNEIIQRLDDHDPVDGGKNPSQQRGSLPVPQVPIRLMNVWYGRPDGVMDPLPF